MDGSDLDRYTFAEDGRVYTDGEIWLPSVSTVLNERAVPQALQNYLQNTPEEKKKEKKFYTQNRGTLIHYNCLSQLVDEEFWSDDEQDSEDCLRGIKEHDETGLTGDYETWQEFQDDREWAMESWRLIRRLYDIHPENVIDVELFVANTDVGYAGQFDLLYVDGDGNTVLGDIKTGKHVYDKNLIQLVAYANAVNIEVDRLEVIRMNPDGRTWEVSTSDEWKEDRDELWEEFKELRNQLEDKKIESLKDRVEDGE